MAGDLSARQSVLYRLSPLTASRISVGFALIAALWLTVGSVRGALIAFIAALAVLVSGYAGRMLAGRRPVAPVEWGLTGCGMVSEFLIYVGVAAAASLHARRAAGPGGRLAARHVRGRVRRRGQRRRVAAGDPGGGRVAC